MNMVAIVTGGAGFVGSNIAVWLKRRFPDWRVISLDNLNRRGSELTLQRLRSSDVEFVHGDVRLREDVEAVGAADWIIDCAAEPSVLAGNAHSAKYVVDNNLLGTVNCLELARQSKAQFIFLSTSRVYPIELLNSINLLEGDTRYHLMAQQSLPGVSQRGISENFPLTGVRSLYGTTKLSSELIIQEYAYMFNLPYVINRCGVIAGPWQMGKVDQGVTALWVAGHYFKKPLVYIGWGGTGKQVRDILDIRDLLALLELQIARFDQFSGQIFNVGGGLGNSVSLRELTELCVEITGNRVPIKSETETRYADVKLYITDNSKIQLVSNWSPQHQVSDTVRSIFEWINQNETMVRSLFS